MAESEPVVLGPEIEDEHFMFVEKLADLFMVAGVRIEPTGEGRPYIPIVAARQIADGLHTAGYRVAVAEKAAEGLKLKR